jgi:sulfur relay (sulfurtransferase) DsrC/TusE family protein
MQVYLIGDNVFKVSDNGYLIDIDSWNIEFSRVMCDRYNVKLNMAEPWIDLARSFYRNFKLIPTSKPFKNYALRSSMDFDSMLSIFGNIELLCLIAGLHKPFMCGCK